MVHFAEINQVPSSYSMLPHTGRVATPNLVPRNCLKYLQRSLIMGGGGLVSEFMRGIVVNNHIRKHIHVNYTYYIISHEVNATRQ